MQTQNVSTTKNQHCPKLICLQTFRTGVLKLSTDTSLIFHSTKSMGSEKAEAHIQPPEVIHSKKTTKP